MDDIINRLAETIEEVSTNTERIIENQLKATDKVLKRYEKLFIGLLIALGIAVVGLVAEHGFTLLYLYKYDFSTQVNTTIDQDAGDGGNASYIGGDGEINNGKAEDH